MTLYKMLMRSPLLFSIFIWTASGFVFKNPHQYVDYYHDFGSRPFSPTHTITSVKELIERINLENYQRIQQLHSSFDQTTPWIFGKWRNAQEVTHPREAIDDVLRFSTNTVDNKTWTHDEQYDWPRMYPQCGGKRQSPINFRARYVKESASTSCLQWYDYTVPQPSIMTSVTKHTVEVASSNGPVPLLRGGPLTGDYKFNGAHFHWGYDQYDGSEHAINSKKASLELHGVHYNAKFRNIAEAIESGESEALVVVAILFQGSRKSNRGIASVLDRVKRQFILNDAVSLSDFGFGFINNYYSYLGSLTTPPCNEVVRWIISGNVQYIKYRELKVLRSLMVDEKLLLDNFRQVQPINGRTIEHYKFC